MLQPGTVFGDYTVLDAPIQRRKSNGAILYEVVCKCGKHSWCTKQDLETGKRNRCDMCGKIKRFGARIDNISINFFNNYKRNALSRGIEFNVSLEYVADLYKKQNGKCALSGMPIEIKGNPWKGQNGSLDRIDSTKGYIEGNVQWLHKTVNGMKWDLEEEKLLELVKQIYNHKQLENYEVTKES